MKVYLLSSLVFAFLLSSCASGPTKDKCSIVKHDEDELYQVAINGKPINKFWYLKDDTNDIWDMLAKDNKCMKRN